MAQMKWVTTAIAVIAGAASLAMPGSADLAPLQFTFFLFTVLSLILLILGSPALRRLV